MKYFRLILILVFALPAFVSAQSNGAQSVTIAPSPYPDKATKPAVVIAEPQQRSAVSEKEIHQEAVAVTPESKLSVGKASVVPSEERRSPHAVSGEKNKITYSEQKIEKQEAPAGNPSINPK